jgi:DMSO/TMAO reductase YedYZ heme-binding membrane subunit
MEKTSKPKNPARAIIAWVFAFSAAYAIIRYHIAGPVPWKDLPFFILNKFVAMSSLILLTFNFALGPLKNKGVNIPNSWLRSRRIVGIMGFMQAFIHVIMSFMLFKPAVYGKFFEPDGTMTLAIGCSMLGGVLGFILLWIYNISFNSEFRKDKDLLGWINSRGVILSGMFAMGVHLFFMGYSGWMKPAGWHGGMPPISLVSFTVFFVGFVINVVGRESR